MDEKLKQVLKLQTEVINKLTKQNMRGLYDDLWGSKNIEETAPQDTALPEGFPELPDLSDLGIDNPVPSIKAKKDSVANGESTKPTAAAKPEAAKEAVKEKVEPEKIEDLKKELDEYIGLAAIKDEVKDLINLVTVQKWREEHGLKVGDLSLHMVFSGNPGTGKTMVARLMSRIYRSLGILSKGHLIEVDRSGLVAGFVGQTAIKTSDAIQKAMGGVLFIDEAYALSNKQGNDFGQEAIDTILKAMEDKRDDLIVIVAGYTELMEDFIHSNPGLESRFNRFLHFADYTAEEMIAIFLSRCEKSAYTLADNAKPLLESVLRFEKENNETFGNARGVRNLFEKAVVAQANRLASGDTITRESLMLLTKEDIAEASEAAARGIEAENTPVLAEDTQAQTTVHIEKTMDAQAETEQQ